MARDVVVIFVHGIGVKSLDYDEPLKQRINTMLGPTLANRVEFKSVFWAQAVRDRQRNFLTAASRAPGFKKHGLHEFVVERLGDAAAYQKTSHRVEATYFTIQAKMRETIRNADNSNTACKDTRPLVFIGHSLGCHIASSYAWDLHKLKHQIAIGSTNAWDANTAEWAAHVESASPMERLDTWAGFITLGSNQPLFTFQLEKDQIFPITMTNQADGIAAFPGCALDPELKAIARWDNIFSKNDPLGYPLKALNNRYHNERRLHDHTVRSEGAIRSFFAFGWFRQLLAERAHERYWTNKAVAAHATKLITDLITAPDAAPSAPHTPPTALPPVPWNIFPHLN